VTQLLEIVRLGLKDLALHKLRALLTALGIILGVAAVITMVSLGEGSKQEALLQIERLGARNIIVRSQPRSDSESQAGQQTGFVNRYGLTRADLRVIEENFSDAETIVPLKLIGSELLKEEKRMVSQAYGTTPDLTEAANIRVQPGGRYLTWDDQDNQRMVCVIGSEVASKFYPFDDPVGQTLRIDDKSLKIVGVLEPVGLSGGAGAALVGRDLNLDVHLPISTARATFGDTVSRNSSGSFSTSEVEVSEIYIVAPRRDRVVVDAERLKRVLEVRHPGLQEVSMIVPFELLENARKSALTWNLVLGAIAGISLLVGGIGIMNIMLATVTERTREIGIRRAIGAKRRQIIGQFLIETVVLSLVGGLIGVGLGLVIPEAIERFADMPTVVTTWSVVLSLSISAGVGIVFGIYPAYRAAMVDPIIALRHE